MLKAILSEALYDLIVNVQRLDGLTSVACNTSIASDILTSKVEDDDIVQGVWKHTQT